MPDHPLIGTITPARALADAGLTHDEIAAELGMSAAQVARLPELAGVAIGPAHVARIEQAMFGSAVGGIAKSDRILDGEVVTLERTVLPDVGAAKLLLTAYAPDTYGQGAAPALQLVIVTDPAELRALQTQRIATRDEKKIIEHQP